MNTYHPQGAAFTALVLEIFRLNGMLLEAGDQLTKPVGLNSARWQVLGIVEHAPAPVAHIARMMGLTRQGVQQTAASLEKEGYVEYLDNPHHRRAKLVSLTSKGREALDYVVEHQVRWANAIGAQHSLEELQSALNVLQALQKSLEQTGRETSGTK